MKYFFILCLFGQFLIAQPTIYIVRHAEKVSGWPGGKLSTHQPLNADGVATSERLSKFMKDIKVTHIYTSETTRTMQTAFPTAKSQKIRIRTHEAVSDTSQIKLFLNGLNTTYGKNDVVLIVSHSNLVPYYLFKYGVKPTDEKYKITKTKSGRWWLTDYYGVVFKLSQGNVEMTTF